MMNHKEINDLLTAYEVDVRFPDVSGMEHLDMLLNRSELARVERSHLCLAGRAFLPGHSPDGRSCGLAQARRRTAARLVVVPRRTGPGAGNDPD